MNKEKFKDKAKRMMIGVFATAMVMIGGKAQAQTQTEKTTDKKEAKKEISTAQKEFADFQNASRAEFEKIQHDSKKEFESFQEENRREMDSIRENNKSIKAVNKTKAFEGFKPAVTPYSVEDKPVKAPVYDDKTKGELNTSMDAEANFDVKKYEYMRNVLSQAMYFMDVVDKNDRGGFKVESNKRAYYDNWADMDAAKLAKYEDGQAEVSLANNYPGLEIKEIEGLKFVSYKGLGYEIKPNGQARFDMDSRSVGPNSGIESRMEKAVQRVKYMQNAKSSGQRR